MEREREERGGKEEGEREEFCAVVIFLRKNPARNEMQSRSLVPRRTGVVLDTEQSCSLYCRLYRRDTYRVIVRNE